MWNALRQGKVNPLLAQIADKPDDKEQADDEPSSAVASGTGGRDISTNSEEERKPKPPLQKKMSRQMSQLKATFDVVLSMNRWKIYKSTKIEYGHTNPIETRDEFSDDLKKRTLELADVKTNEDERRSSRCHFRRGFGLSERLAPEYETDHTVNYVACLALIKLMIQAFENKKKTDISWSKISKIVEKGASINCSDMYGQTPLHEAVRVWSYNLTVFFVNDLKAKINVVDTFGRSPLHIAASLDRHDICSFLISEGADKEVKTFDEGQTPLFYAAKFDSGHSLSVLLKAGCEYKTVRDGRQRTPLHVAADMDSSVAASKLLEWEAPSHLIDSSFRPAIIPMAENMPCIAKEALDQFHVIDRQQRRQHFYLANLERHPDCETQMFSSVLDVVAEFKLYEVLLHPSLKQLINRKWEKFARIRVIGQVIFQVIYILSWAVFGVAKEWHLRHEYKFPNDVWIVLLLIFAVLMTLVQLGLEIVEYMDDKKNYNAWKAYRTKIIRHDMQFSHPRWPDEAEMHERELRNVEDKNIRYFSDWWNFFDWFTVILLAICTCLHIADVANHSLTLARWFNRFMAIAIIILGLRFMKVVRCFSLLGPFIVILGEILEDLIRFLFLYLEFFIPFAFAFWMLLGGTENISYTYVNSHSVVGANVTYLSVMDFATVYDMLFSMFRMTLVDNYDYETMIKIDHIMAQIMVGTWLAISAILCINLFIALLSHTFQRVYDNSISVALMEKTIAIMSVERGLSKPRFSQYLVELMTECDPMTLFYDDDVTTSDYDMKRAVIEARDDIKELQEKLDKLIKRHDTTFGEVHVEEEKRPPPMTAQLSKMTEILDNRMLDMEKLFESLIDNMNERYKTQINDLGSKLNELVEQTQERNAWDAARKDVVDRDKVVIPDLKIEMIDLEEMDDFNKE